MAVYQIYNGGGEHTIRYRFTCEKCGKTSDWLEYTVRIGYIVRVSGSYNMNALKLGEQEALTKKIAKMKKRIAQGYMFESPLMEKTEYSYDLDRKCPFCGTKQHNKGTAVEYDWNGK